MSQINNFSCGKYVILFKEIEKSWIEQTLAENDLVHIVNGCTVCFWGGVGGGGGGGLSPVTHLRAARNADKTLYPLSRAMIKFSLIDNCWYSAFSSCTELHSLSSVEIPFIPM